MANEADEIMAEYKKLRQNSALGRSDRSVVDRMFEAMPLIGGKYKKGEEDAKAAKKREEERKKNEAGE